MLFPVLVVLCPPDSKIQIAQYISHPSTRSLFSCFRSHFENCWLAAAAASLKLEFPAYSQKTNSSPVQKSQNLNLFPASSHRRPIVWRRRLELPDLLFTFFHHLTLITATHTESTQTIRARLFPHSLSRSSQKSFISLSRPP